MGWTLRNWTQQRIARNFERFTICFCGIPPSALIQHKLNHTPYIDASMKAYGTVILFNSGACASFIMAECCVAPLKNCYLSQFIPKLIARFSCTGYKVTKIYHHLLLTALQRFTSCSQLLPGTTALLMTILPIQLLVNSPSINLPPLETWTTKSTT